MADITMCPGGRCPVKENCYRYKANPSTFMQSYFCEVPWRDDEPECKHHWPIREEKKKNDKAGI